MPAPYGDRYCKFRIGFFLLEGFAYGFDLGSWRYLGRLFGTNPGLSRIPTGFARGCANAVLLGSTWSGSKCTSGLIFCLLSISRFRNSCSGGSVSAADSESENSTSISSFCGSSGGSGFGSGGGAFFLRRTEILFILLGLRKYFRALLVQDWDPLILACFFGGPKSTICFFLSN